MAFLHDQLRAMGYEIAVDAFASSDYMLPQRRKRAFAVAIDCQAFGLERENARLFAEPDARDSASPDRALAAPVDVLAEGPWRLLGGRRVQIWIAMSQAT